MLRKKINKSKILDFYPRSADGRIIIDLAVDKVDYLYSDFEKHAPYVKRGLDSDLADYLLDSVREIGKEPFYIHFRFLDKISAELESRVRTSIQNYFLYSRELEYRELRQMFRTSFILLVIGLGILTMSVWFTRYIFSQQNLLSNVFSESLAVAAWVSLWESLTTVLIHWTPRKRTIRNCEKLINAEVFFN